MPWSVSNYQNPEAAIYALAHDPYVTPYVSGPTANSSRNCAYLYAEQSTPVKSVVNGLEAVDPSTIPINSYQGQPKRPNIISDNDGFYKSAFNSQAYGSVRLAPLGACLSAWSWIGGDPYYGEDQSVDNLTIGWRPNTIAGLAGKATNVKIPAGGGTVLFAVIKGPAGSTYAPGTYFEVKWLRQNGPHAPYEKVSFGKLELSDMPDSENFPNYAGGQHVYSAMVFPLVVYSASECYMTVELHRNFSGGLIWLGRPVVIPGYCNWLGDRYYLN